MSSRPQYNPKPVFDSTTSQDMTLTLNSLVTIIQKLSMVSYAVTWSGSTPVGTLVAQVSNDYSTNSAGDVSNPGTWNNIPFNLAGVLVNSIPISGDSGNGFIDIDQLAGYAIRLQYIPTSGIGTLGAVVNCKVS